ncbi:putative proteinase [Aspergillus stella-maris]|uniref:putative proteinase n=1 Tax=Aspergillus stella-maris TaxID=1810926 RepID=UPI003CCD3D07
MEDRKRFSLPSSRDPGDCSTRCGSCRRIVSPTVLALTVLAGLWWLFPASQEVNPNSSAELVEPSFSWSQITPSTSLEYHDCFGGYQCARLDVPMDYHRSDGQGTRMAIAITRLPAKVPVTDPRYGGAILINPGGPGGSGVASALISGHNLQTIVDSSVVPSDVVENLQDQYYDIIGFDPRSVGSTTPGFSCFPDLFSQQNWELQAEADGMLGSSADSLMRNWQRALALNTGCSRAVLTPLEDGDALGEHTNTPPVARDMLEIVERHGEWRERQGLSAQRQHDKRYGYNRDQPMAERTKWYRGQEKLLYWGRSYGTLLGSTFAALFPDRVERMVLDGVVDAGKYYTGVGPEPIGDADAIFEKFAIYCEAAGDDCPFFAAGGPTAIKEAYMELENSLLNSSMAVLPSKTRGPEVVTWTDLRTILRISIYQPLAGFAYLATIANDLARGDGSGLADFKLSRRSPSCPTSECLSTGPWSSECLLPWQSEMYSSSAILCSDAEYLQDPDQEAFKEHWHSLQQASNIFGHYWAHTRLNCAGWNVTAKWRMPTPVTGNTSHPLLIVNNVLDPITPLRSAKNMNAAFPKSVLLQQDSEGHCTLAAPSVCTSQAIRKYFQTGDLPAPGSTCDADVKPVLGTPNKIDETELSLDEIALRNALLDEALRMGPLRVPM